MAPCQFCYNAVHTLQNCDKICMDFVNQLCISSSKKGPVILNECLKHMRTPVLKCLAKHTGGIMNQTRQDLHNWCFKQFAYCSPYVVQKIKDYDAEHEETCPELGPKTAIETKEWERVRDELYKHIIQKYLSKIERIGGIHHLHRNYPNYFTVFCRWIQGQPRRLHDYDYFNIQALMIINSGHLPAPSPTPVRKNIKVSLRENFQFKCENDDSCSICLESVPYIETNCHHHYCNCILHYISKYNTKCPLCREEINTLTYNNREMHKEATKIFNIKKS